MIDLHCHVLPGIDDGARSLEDAVEMCRAAAQAGTEVLVATPHQRRAAWWNCNRIELVRLRRMLQDALGPSPRILGGGEIHVSSGLLREMAELDKNSQEGPLPLAESRYLLLEFAAEASPAEAADTVHELSVCGWRAILAHPEHIHWMANDTSIVAHLVSLGALTQLTAMSVTGDFGRRALSFAHRLIDQGLAHFVASDAHDLRRRPPGLQLAWEEISRQWGEAAARELLVDNPRAVVQNLPLGFSPGPETVDSGLQRTTL
jgi:protein-tyrosine phosphatase